MRGALRRLKATLREYRRKQREEKKASKSAG
jgi:hypothetical protein